VISVELEPVPRGFAFPLALLALGLLARGREKASGWAIAAAALFHAPAIWPTLLIRPFRKRWLIPLAAAAALLLLSAAFAHSSQMNPFFGAVSPEHERLQRLRASYNWITAWYARFLSQHTWTALIALLAYWRMRPALPERFRPYVFWLPLTGLASVPVSWLLLEKLKWNLMPQIQPMRSLLYTVVIALLLCSLAGLRAAAQGRWWEAPIWLYLPCLLPLSPDWNRGPYTVPAALALIVAITAWLAERYRQPALIAAAAAALVFLPVTWAKVKNYPQLEFTELEQLVAWARASTAPDAVFVFRDYGRTDPNHAGWFRSRALRSLFVDYKGGGQVNYYEKWAFEWWRRWLLVEQPYAEDEFAAWRRRRVDYLIFKKPPPGLATVYSNARFAVVAVPR
jgi:hypothetical protein